MKKRFLYVTLFSLVFAACTEQEIIEQPSTPDNGGTEVQLPTDINSGELLIKFKPEMSDILDKTMTRAASNGVMTRSGIPSTDEVLEILGGYHFERVFPIDPRNEKRTRTAGLHLWYLVKFDENTDLQEAANKLSKLGEISKVQGNSRIKRSYNTKGYRTYVNENLLRQKSITRAGISTDMNDLGLAYQWHYINDGSNEFDNLNPNKAGSIAGCDVGCEAAWKKCTGDPSIIVAVLDEGVMNTHPDLKGNIWINEGEELHVGKDADGNGYEDDKYGYNFVNKTGVISWTDVNDTGHGTHVAGTIAAMNNNNEGVCGIAGGNGNPNTGVKIMSCQVFSGQYGVTLDGEAKAIKYAADNGAVILQCSWGYNSAEANEIEGFVPGPATEKEWESLYPLEKEALDYFINNAGSPNGVIEGGIAIFASGNEYAGVPAYPGAYSKCVAVSAVAADFTPSSYTNYGIEVDLCAPGGDAEYYNEIGKEDPEYWSKESPLASGSILSTMIRNGNPAYGYMDGTSMACPHVSGVAALGLSYAVQQRRHFKASEFVTLMKESVKPVDDYYVGKTKTYYRNHTIAAASPMQVNLSKYIGKMGTGLIDAGKLLDNIDGKTGGSDMKVPNVYVAEGAKSTINLAYYFVNGESLTYTCTSSDDAVATVAVNGTLMDVTGIKTGAAHITVKVSNGTEQTITVTVRKNANDNGWM
jgi:hypothetical protein